MKSFLFAIFFIHSFVYAQNDKRDVLNPNQLEVKKLTLEVEKTAQAAFLLPFKNIRIIDSRPDTSKIGYMPVENFLTSKKKLFKKIVLGEGNSNSIENYYNEYYADSYTKNDFELLIVMKRFWLSGAVNINNKRVEVTNSVKFNDNIYCKWEYYIGKEGKYLPVRRLDTVIQNNEGLKKYSNDKNKETNLTFIKYTLRALIEILDYSNVINQFNLKPKKTLNEIYEYNKRMNLIPVLMAEGFRKGVYLNIDEFKNNNPSISDFIEKKMHYGIINTENYLEDIHGVTISNYWGYSDGKIFRYGMFGNDKIYRIQNTYCFFIKVVGYIISSGNETSLNAGSSINTTSKSKYEVWVPYQLDLETGQIY